MFIQVCQGVRNVCVGIDIFERGMGLHAEKRSEFVERAYLPREVSPTLSWSGVHLPHQLACGEIAAFQGVFGKGMYYTIPKEYVKAMFEDERLPFEEGWTPRKTPFMFPELWALLKLISNRAWPF